MKTVAAFDKGVWLTPQTLKQCPKIDKGKSCFPGLPTAEGTMNPAYNDKANASLLSEGQGSPTTIQPLNTRPTNYSS